MIKNILFNEPSGGLHPRFIYPMKYRDLMISVGIAFGVFLLLLYTSSWLPFTWDEGVMAKRSEQLVLGLQQITKQILDIKNFGYGEEGHPHFPVFLNAFGQAAAPSFLPIKTQFRFGNIAFFSFAAGMVFFRLKKDFGIKTALFGIFSLLLIPRLFAHIQIAFYDSPLISAWLLSWACFPSALKSEKGAAVFGGFVGLTVASKFSGIGVVLPPILWLAVRLIADRFTVSENRLSYRGINLLNLAVIATFAALFVFWLFNPMLWLDPIGGMGRFFYLNTHRTINVAVLFFGTMYDLHHSLPWYNTLLWTMITVPIGLLALFGIGIVTIIRARDKHWTGLLIFLNMLVLLVMRSLPGTPVHDGVRLFIPAFAFLAIIAAIGASQITNFKAADVIVRRTAAYLFFSILIYAVCLFNMFWYAPQWLSFYNLATGGLPGAVRAGMEPTYYGDGFDGEVFAWLKSNVKADEKIAFSIYSNETLQLCFSEANLRIPFEIADETATLDGLKALGCRYYILQRRPSGEFERDKQLIEQSRPIFIKTIRKGGFGYWNLSSVPIVEIYDLNNKKKPEVLGGTLPAL